MQINDVPSALFAWDNMHRAPCIDQHATILLLLGRLPGCQSSMSDRTSFYQSFFNEIVSDRKQGVVHDPEFVRFVQAN